MLTIIIILAVLTLLFGILEIFIIPGFGIAGITAILCALADAVLIYCQFGLLPACLAVLAAVILLFVALRWFAKSKTLDKMALHTAIESTAATQEQLSVKVGDEGKALTRLALVGNADFDGKMVEVKSAGDFIPPGTRIRVININEANVTVEVIKD